MIDERETEFHGNVVSEHESDRTGNKVFASFGGALTIAAILIVALIVLIWWLSAR
jgi:hypothetical protein